MLPNGFKSNWINREYKYAVIGNYPGVSYIKTNVRRNSLICLVLKLSDWRAECPTLALMFNLTIYVTGSWSIADFFKSLVSVRKCL